jgi:transcriptional regulator with XRE-family HTH domain
MEQSPHKSKIELYVINKVKELRLQHGKSQADLAADLNVSYGFIGQVENPKYRTKYNINHIDRLAQIFKCSPKDFIPEKPLNHGRNT